MTSSDAIYEFCGFQLDSGGLTLSRENERLHLEPRVFDLIHHLVLHRGRTVSKDELIREVWQGTTVSDSALTRAMSLARRVLGRDSDDQSPITTVHGRGYRFDAVVLERAPQPVGTAPREAGESRYVGREHELAILDKELGAALGGELRTVLLVGEPGIGKTRTAQEIADRARARGAAVHIGRFLADEGAPAYWGWVQVLRSEINTLDPADLPALLGDDAAHIAQLVPELRSLVYAPAPTPLHPTQARFRLFEAIVRFLVHATQRRPLVLVLEDLHCADASSLALIEFLASSVQGVPLMAVGTIREGDPRAPRDVLAAAARQHSTRVVRLGGLSVAEVESLAEAESGTILRGDLARDLHRRSGGNPFFVLQLLAAGSIAEGERSSIPSGIREAIAQQVAALPEQTRKILSIASVIGSQFPAAVAARVVGWDEAMLLDALHPAEAANIVAEVSDAPGDYRFSHMLLREALYEEHPAGQRSALHWRVGEALSDLSGGTGLDDPSTIAHHFYLGRASGDSHRAREFAQRAGERANERFAYEAAAAQFRRAIELLGEESTQPVALQCELWLALGEAERRSGRRDEARAALERGASLARLAGAWTALGRLAVGLDSGFYAFENDAVDTTLIRLLEEASRGIDRSEVVLRARLAARLSLAYRNVDPKRREQYEKEAQTLCRATGDPVSQLWSQCLSWNKEHNTEVELPLEVQPCEDQAVDQGEYELPLVCCLFRISALLARADIAATDAAITRFGQLAAATRSPQAASYVEQLAAMRALLEGRFDEAEVRAHRFLKSGQLVQDFNAVQGFSAVWFLLAWEHGHGEELLRVTEPMLAEHPRFVAWRAPWLVALCETGNLERARAFLSSWDLTELQDAVHWSTAAVFLAEVFARVEDRRHAARLYQWLEPLSGQLIVPSWANVVCGAADRPLGILAALLGEKDAACKHFERAIELETRAGARAWLAHTRYHYARLLWSQGGREARARSESLASESLQTAKVFGMTALEQRVRSLEVPPTTQ